MRLSLRRAVQWVCFLTMIQIVVYYWATRRPNKPIINVQLHRFLEPLGWEDGVCSTKKCPAVKDDVINVHLIPHSHIDVGWVKNVEQYYVGEDVPNVWATGCVKCTLNGTITELLKNSSRRFIFVEMKYLSRFWDEIDELQRSALVQLIKSRRIEIASGGWVSSDAAVTMYNDIIDQHTLGFDFVREKFGSCAHSRFAWNVDQFGHTREHASIFSQMGYDSLFIGRIDSQDLIQRKKDKELEFLWRTSPVSLRERSNIFTHILFDGYYAPGSFNFETDVVSWTDEASAQRAAESFIHVIKERSAISRTNHLLIPMGCDFGYKGQAADVWFTNMDQLIQKVTELQANIKGGPRFHLFYSTPSCYTRYVNNAHVTLPTKIDDFHPYGIEQGAYWTGYFTTRGGLKMHIKKAGQILQSCKHLAIFAELNDMFHNVNTLRDAVAVMQHHDAITGTQRYEVLLDYNFQLSKAIQNCETVMSSAYTRLWSIANGINHQSISVFCHDLNISSCAISEGNHQFMISLYNPLSWPTDVVVRFPVKADQVSVVDYDGLLVPVQLVPVPEGIMRIPERQSTAKTEAVFQVHALPMSVTSFRVIPGTEPEKAKSDPNMTEEIIIQNEHLLLKFSASTGRLKYIYNKHSHIKSNIQHEFAYYKTGENGHRTSGAYLFVPSAGGTQEVASGNVQIKVIKGDVVEEVHQNYSSWVSQVIRLYKGAKYAEFQWVVGPLNSDRGREVISRFNSTLSTSNKFYTDSNGREVMQRIRRPSNYTESISFDGISGNYYPITTRIFIKDDEQRVQLTILPDRPQGGSSLASGSIELMVHRRTLLDDNLGLAEALLDPGLDGKGIIFTGKHYLYFETIQDSARLTRHMAQQLNLGPVPMFTSRNEDLATSMSIPPQVTLLFAPLPPNVQILTLDRVSSSETNLYLLRLEHIFEEKEDIALSAPVKVSLENLFVPFKILAAQETTLGGNFQPQDIIRLKWDTVGGVTGTSIKSPDYKHSIEAPFEITLLPMEIRTFHVQVVWSKSF